MMIYVMSPLAASERNVGYGDLTGSTEFVYSFMVTLMSLVRSISVSLCRISPSPLILPNTIFLSRGIRLPEYAMR